MALINCPSCNAPLSVKAKRCHVCGFDLNPSQAREIAADEIVSVLNEPPPEPQSQPPEPPPQLGKAPTPPPSSWKYPMVQIPSGIILETSERGNEAAVYLERVVNDMATNSWEFFRVDSIGVAQASGCLGAFLGVPDQMRYYYVITFRKRV